MNSQRLSTLMDRKIEVSCLSERKQRRCTEKNSKINQYQLLETIGIGGFAKVKKGIHVPTGEKVAVKVINLLKMTESQKRSLMREIDIHKGLIHQNIAQIYEVIQSSDSVYIFMEYCSQGELFDFINVYGAFSKKTARKIFHEVFSAVCYLHENGIAHRDIKTENILLDDKGHAKLIDFGLSSYYNINKNDDMLKTFCGSPSYLSPEMVRGAVYSPKMVDVWCLGVTLYAMLRAELPFYDLNPNEQKRRIKQIQYRNIGDPEVDKLLEQIFKPASSRISLEEIKKADFLLKGKFPLPNYLMPESQFYAIDEQIIKNICQLYSLNSEEIQKSVQEKNLNQLYCLYFLTLEKNRKSGYPSSYDVKSAAFRGKDKMGTWKHLKKSKQTNHRSHQTQISEKLDSLKKASKTPRKFLTIETGTSTIYSKKEKTVFPALVLSTNLHRRRVSQMIGRNQRRGMDLSPGLGRLRKKSFNHVL